MEDAIQSRRQHAPLVISQGTKVTATLSGIAALLGIVWTISGAWHDFRALADRQAVMELERREDRERMARLEKSLQEFMSSVGTQLQAQRVDVSFMASSMQEIKSALGIKPVATTPPYRLAGGSRP